MVGARNPSAPRAFWEAEIDVRQIKNKRTFTFPKDDVGGYAIFFAFDAERSKNELSSSAEETTGHITFEKADSPAGIDFRIHAHLDSEFSDQAGVDV